MLHDDYFYRRLDDMFMSVDRTMSVRYTPFLDGLEVALAENYIKSIQRLYPQVGYRFWGGFESAERKVLCVYHQYVCCDVQDFPLNIVEFNYNVNFSKPTHRDFLGAIMALRVKRESIGDILVSVGKTQVVVGASVSSVILDELNRVGRLGVKAALVDTVTVEVKQEFKSITGTVPSLRLDCVLGVAMNVSRSRAVQVVKSKVVTVDYLEETSPAYTVSQGDVIAVKGYGKYVLAEVSEPTKKNRLHVLINKYL